MHKYIIIALSLCLVASCKKEAVIFDDGPNASFELPLILKLNGKSCFYDEASGLLNYSLAENALENFAPQTEFRTNATFLFAGNALKNNAINHLGTIVLHKRYAVEITVEGETKHLQLEFTDMPLVRIVAFDEITNEPKTLAKLTVSYAELHKAEAVDWVGIELRGASSLSLDKKSYGFGVYADRSTDNAILGSYFGLKANSKWILDAMYVDKGRCRNKASFSLWASMGDNNNHPNIHSVFVEVFLNNRSVGLYCLNENISEELFDLQKQAVLYKGIDNSDVTFFNKLPEKEPVSARWAEWEQKFPNPSKRIVWGDFKALSELIVEGSDAEFTAAIGSLIDLDNVIDYYLFVNLCKGTDDVGKNWQFLKRSAADKFIIVPWDLDATWGRDAVGSPESASGYVTNQLFRRLKTLNPEGYNQRVTQRWNELRADQFSQMRLFALFEDNFGTLEHYHILETENSIWHQSYNNAQEQAYLESWIVDRLAYLDVFFQ
jgi:spore coat protein H